VMSHGRIVEHGPSTEILRNASHEATRQLIAAVPRLPRSFWPATQQ
jgi:ABC-type dipeptide/oligopeptide/nickel transport system ATPase component